MKNALFLLITIFCFLSCEKSTEIDLNQDSNSIQEEHLDLRKNKGRISCENFKFEIITLEKKDNCCKFSISVIPPEGLLQGVVVDYHVDGVHVSSLNVLNPVAIPLELCYDESTIIEFYLNGELCFSEKVFCADCCSHYTYDLWKDIDNEGCCQFVLEVGGPIDCLNAVDISVIGNPGPISSDKVFISGNRAIVTLCDPDSTAVFQTSIFGESCWRSDLLSSLDCD